MARYSEYEHEVVSGDTFKSLAKRYYADEQAGCNLAAYNNYTCGVNEDAAVPASMTTVRMPLKLHVLVGPCNILSVSDTDTFESIAETHYGDRNAAEHIRRLCGVGTEKPADKRKSLMLPKRLGGFTRTTEPTKDDPDKKLVCILLFPRVYPELEAGISL